MDARRSQSSTDGRRRRMLATQETQELLAEFEALAPQPVIAAAPAATVIASDRPFLQRIISGQLWKHVAVIVSIGLLAAATIWLENRPPQGLRELTTRDDLRMSHGLTGILLLLTGQMSLLIGWIRSHSTVDYSGRYRCWKWLAACLFIAGTMWITNVQDSMADFARFVAEPMIGFIGAARRTLVVVPVSAISIWVLSRVIPDMGRNRWSQIGFTTGVIIAIARLLPAEASASAWLALPALNGVLLSAATLIMASLLLHARFVLYVSKDPPERRRTKKPAARGDQAGENPGAAEKATQQKKSARKARKRKKETPPEPPAEPAIDEPEDLSPASWADTEETDAEGSDAGEARTQSTSKERKRR